jgi:hypothetical protein
MPAFCSKLSLSFMSGIAFGEGSRNQTFGRPAVSGQPLEDRLQASIRNDGNFDFRVIFPQPDAYFIANRP